MPYAAFVDNVCCTYCTMAGGITYRAPAMTPSSSSRLYQASSLTTAFEGHQQYREFLVVNSQTPKLPPKWQLFTVFALPHNAIFFFMYRSSPKPLSGGVLCNTCIGFEFRPTLRAPHGRFDDSSDTTYRDNEEEEGIQSDSKGSTCFSVDSSWDPKC